MVFLRTYLEGSCEYIEETRGQPTRGDPPAWRVGQGANNSPPQKTSLLLKVIQEKSRLVLKQGTQQESGDIFGASVKYM